MINFYAKEEHFKDHLQPIYQKLSDGGFDVRWVLKDDRAIDDTKWAVVASSGDLNKATGDKKMVFYAEHGAGQSYSMRHSSYAGGQGRDNVCMFLSPGPHVSAKNKHYYPHIPDAEVGVPKLDDLHLAMSPELPSPKPVPVVCISFHWDCNVCPETKSGFAYFKNSIDKLAEIASNKSDKYDSREFELVGHCHPRARKEVKPYFEKLGIRFIEKFEDVLTEADVYVCDNSSTIFEFASIGKPVVLLNPPHYRKHVSHGLRFWTFATIGPNAKNFQTLLDGIRECIHDTRENRALRKSMIDQIYHKTDGGAAERAAIAIIEHIEEFNKMEKMGNYILVKKHSLGTFGLVEPGQRISVFPKYCLIHDKIGNFKRRMNFTEEQDVDVRIRKTLKIAPNNYEMVEATIDLTIDDDDILGKDFSAGSKDNTEGFKAVDRSFTEQELYIIQMVREGKGKTEICYHSGDKGENYSREDMLRAWDRLKSQDIIVKGEGKLLWEINTVGSDKG